MIIMMMDDYYCYYDYYDYYDHYYWDEAVNKLNNFPLENKWKIRNEKWEIKIKIKMFSFAH